MTTQPQRKQPGNPGTKKHLKQYPRALALRVITEVLSRKLLLDEVLEQAMKTAPPESVGWLQDVCAGTLRWKGRLDWILDETALKKKPSGRLRKSLLLASYQLLLQSRVHPGLVVSEAVAEIKAREGQGPGQFANAYLRKVVQHAKFWQQQPFPEQAPLLQQAAWASLPVWMWQKFVAQQGQAWAQAYALASLERPVVWMRLRNGGELTEQLSKDAGGVQAHLPATAEPGPIPGSWSVQAGGRVADWPGLAEGTWIIQDISSQRLLVEVKQFFERREQGERASGGGDVGRQILDLCAAPGGKSVGLAWSGWDVVATDISESRSQLLRETLLRVAVGGRGGAVGVGAGRVQQLSWQEAAQLPLQEVIWLDAPCSGSGILRRHPEVRWLRQETDLLSLVETQTQLFQEAWSRLKPQGFLIYSVCSVLKEEGPELLSRLGLTSQVRASWFFVPQEPPYGDGFWAAIVQKN